MASKTSFGSEDVSLGRISMLSVAPPQTVALLKLRVMKAEDLIGYNIQLFKDIDGEVPMNDSDPISLQRRAIIRVASLMSPLRSSVGPKSVK